MVNPILIYPLVFTLFLSPSNIFNKSIYSSFDEGEKLYNQKDYKGALKTFLDAQVENPGDIKLKYNIASTQYKIKNYAEAIKGYSDIAKNSKDRFLQEKSYYNSGNCFYREGKLPEAAQYYKKALGLDPNDKDAKYNLELVLEKLKKQQYQQKQPEKDKDKKEDKDKSKDKKNSGQNDRNDKKKEDEKQKQDMKKNQEKEPQQEEKPKMASKKLSKEEADMLLNSLKEDRKNFFKEQLMKKGAVPYNPAKDW